MPVKASDNLWSLEVDLSTAELVFAVDDFDRHCCELSLQVHLNPDQ